jgi:hypothetical protein
MWAEESEGVGVAASQKSVNLSVEGIDSALFE